MSRFDTVHIYADLERFRQPALMGELHCQQSRSGEIFSFNYDRTWLAGAETFAFDPDLALVAGHQYPASDRANFGIFLDSSPDRWGRVLMQRRENSRARQEGRRARTLTEWDFLLGVHDETDLARYVSVYRPTVPSLTVMHTLQLLRSPRFANCKPLASNLKSTSTKKSIPSIKDG